MSEISTQKPYYPQIDAIKGFAIIAVILLHLFPQKTLTGYRVWYYIGQAVPLFLVIQAIHTASSMENKSITEYFTRHRFNQLIRRVIIPFLAINTLGLALLFIKDTTNAHFSHLFYAGGIGPGAYYPYIYLQAWITLPFIVIVSQRLGQIRSLLLFVMIAILMEAFWQQHDILWIYNLSISRYLFLLYLGVSWKLFPRQYYNLILIPASVLLYEAELSGLLKHVAWIYTTPWIGHHWWNYFYSITLFSILFRTYRYYNSAAVHLAGKLGKWSYEIFLCQMLLFSCISFRDSFSFWRKHVNLTVDPATFAWSWRLTLLILSTLSGYLLYKLSSYLNNVKSKRTNNAVTSY